MIPGVCRGWCLFFALAFPLLSQTDAISDLGRRIEMGGIRPTFGPERGYLPWLLKTLDIPVESQLLVFSKTSVQSLRIEPCNPRMLYFNDSVVVGTLKGGQIEVAAQDPSGGFNFYVLDQNPARFNEWAARPKPTSPFSYRPDCVTACHQSKSGIPQLRLRSVKPGIPIEQQHGPDTDIRTPFSKLFGGWFVTGTVSANHMGNTRWDENGKPIAIQPPGQSDIAALLVFEHQIRAMNLIAQTAFAVRHGDRLNQISKDLTDYLKTSGSMPLPTPVRSSSAFARTFSARGPLYELDLQTRLLRGPYSYMVMSPAFEALPEHVRSTVLRALHTSPE